MQKKKDIIKMIGDYPERVTEKCADKIITAATAYAKKLYGDKKEPEVKGAVIAKSRFSWGRFAYIAACSLAAVMVAILVLVPPVGEERFETITEVNLTSIESIQAYNEQNGTDYLFFDTLILQEQIKKATSKEKGEFAFLWQSAIISSGDLVDLYISPINIRCSKFVTYELLSTKVEIYNKEIYYSENFDVSLDRYITMLRFEHENTNYYLQVSSETEGAFYTYIDELLGFNE